jgi:hypothetical protein
MCRSPKHTGQTLRPYKQNSSEMLDLGGFLRKTMTKLSDDPMFQTLHEDDTSSLQYIS